MLNYRGAPVSEDVRDVVDVLRYELNFLEQGGLERLGPEASPFLSTMTCLNFDLPLRSHACHECLLYDFVPQEARLNDNPCHFIPLNDKGATIATLTGLGDQRLLRDEVGNWLRTKIAQIESGAVPVSAEK